MVRSLKPARRVDVAIFIPTLGGGGAERVAVLLANRFSEVGLDVDLVCCDPRGPWLAHVDRDVRLVDLKQPSTILSTGPLARYLREARPKALLSFLDRANVVAVLARALSGLRCRLVLSQRSHLSESQRRASGFRNALLSLLIRACYGWADAIVGISDGVSADLVTRLGIPANKVHTVHNPVVLSSNMSAGANPTHPWLDTNGPPVVLAVGRLTAAKDYPTLLRALATMVRRRSLRLIIAGEGELRSDIERLVTELEIDAEVALVGFVADPLAWMAKADVFVFSSAWEGFGNVLVEAMSTGTPVVSTDCRSGPAEILEHGKWGSLVPVGDDDALAEAILASLEQDKRNFAVERALDFSVERAAEAYLRVMQVKPPKLS